MIFLSKSYSSYKQCQFRFSLPLTPTLPRARTRNRPFGPQGASRPMANKNSTARP